MKKEIEILKNYILYFLVFVVICLVGVSGVFALTTKTIYSDLALSNSNKYNYGYTNAGGIDDVTTGIVGNRINGKTKYIGFYLSENISLNYTYTIRINFLSDDIQPYFSLNYVRRIETCNSSSCSNASIVAIRKQNNNGYSTWVELDFNPTQTGSKIGVVLGNDNGNYITGETYFGISSVQIESKNANQDVINNATNNTNNIINNNNSNTENIINNQNSNTDKEIESQQVCKIIDKDDIVIDNKSLGGTGSLSDNNRTGVTDYTKIYGSKVTILNSSNTTYWSTCFYNVNKSLISCVGNDTLVSNQEINLPSNTYYMMATIVKSTNMPQFQICTNGNQSLNDSIDEQTKTSKGILGKLGDLISYINPLSENFFVYKMVDLFLDMLKKLFIPEDMSFINEFMDTLSNKLGFIASIPIRLIQFILDLPSVAFNEVNSLHFPRISIFGYYFWDDMEIDLSVGKSIFQTFKYLTDMTCVILCVNTLYKWYHTFSGGDAS